jgi:hypothetical protein
VEPQLETASHRVDRVAKDELFELIGIVRQGAESVVVFAGSAGGADRRAVRG